MTTLRRLEWRGDLFTADLPRFLDRLADVPITPYVLPHTVTVFLLQEESEFSLDQTLRLRSYSNLPEVTAESVRRFMANGLAAKLQLKAVSGAIAELGTGRVTVPYTSAEPGARDELRQLQMGSESFTPTSVRVARRVHYKLAGDLISQPVRITVDHERTLFRVGGGMVKTLGDMGPRVEIKATDDHDLNWALRALNPDGLLRRLPYHSLELLFQDLLRTAVPPGPSTGVSEIEVKFELAALDLRATAAAVIGWLSRRTDTRLLLPFPHQIVRMRRYHFCEGEDDGAQCTVVETTAGRLSAKVKRDAEVHGRAVVRNTSASRSTDVDGGRERPEVFIRRHGWRRINMMTKVQAKIPFALLSGNAYLASIDDCLDPCGTPLRQLELEYIGSIGAPTETKEICGELDALAAALERNPAGVQLRPTTQSKHDFFRRHVPS